MIRSVCNNDNDDCSRDNEKSNNNEKRSFLKYGTCETINKYKIIKLIAKGSYGHCYKANKISDDDNTEFVVLKKVIMHNESSDGFPITTLREIKTLRQIGDHPNCIKLQKVIVDNKHVFLVFDYCENDLGNLIMTKLVKFTESESKNLILQLLNGLSFIHSHNIIHRDLKLSNLLYDKGKLKICDFGLARVVASDMTNNVVTLWYRSPEILLGSKNYTSSIDIWSCACIFCELLLFRPLFPGNDEMDQLRLIFSCLGIPQKHIWPSIHELPLTRNGFVDLTQEQQKFGCFNNLRIILPRSISEEGFHLLLQLLAYDPNKRLTASTACHHTYFSQTPLPCRTDLMPFFYDNL